MTVWGRKKQRGDTKGGLFQKRLCQDYREMGGFYLIWSI